MKNKKYDVLTPEIAKDLIRYEADTGLLFWKPRSALFFLIEGQCNAWNRRYAGKEAFTAIDDKGYKVGSMLNKDYRAHRLIWFMETGSWPIGDVDHVDGDTLNNAIANLRDVSHLINRRNSAKNKNNTSGVAGVFWNRQRRKWVAQIRVGKSVVYLGIYKTIEEAAAARKLAEMQNGYHPNHGRAA